MESSEEQNLATEIEGLLAAVCTHLSNLSERVNYIKRNWCLYFDRSAPAFIPRKTPTPRLRVIPTPIITHCTALRVQRCHGAAAGAGGADVEQRALAAVPGDSVLLHHRVPEDVGGDPAQEGERGAPPGGVGRVGAWAVFGCLVGLGVLDALRRRTHHTHKSASHPL